VGRAEPHGDDARFSATSCETIEHLMGVAAERPKAVTT